MFLLTVTHKKSGWLTPFPFIVYNNADMYYFINSLINAFLIINLPTGQEDEKLQEENQTGFLLKRKLNQLIKNHFLFF